MKDNFATAYRPSTFAEVVGQDITKSVLTKIALSTGISVRSIFLKGAFGSGKSTMARIFGRALNCSNFQKTHDVCNECNGCHEGSILNSQTYWEFDSTAVGNVEAIRALHDKLTVLPPNNMRRLVVFDEAHACVDYRTPILLESGACEMEKVINSPYDLNVKSMDFTTGKPTIKKIINKFDNGQDFKTKWYRLQWNGGVGRFTANHNLYKNGKKIAVENLMDEDYVDCSRVVLSEEGYQVLIGTLLGDSLLCGFDRKRTSDSTRSKARRNVEFVPVVQLIQGVEQQGYLDFKASFFNGYHLNKLEAKAHTTKGCKGGFRYSINSIKEASKLISLHSTKDSYKDIASVLNDMGPIAWLIWYLDEGHYNKSGHIEISCTNIGVKGAIKVKDFCLQKFGWDLRVYQHKDSRSLKPYVKLRWTKDDTISFFEYTKSLIDIPCINYKIPEWARGTNLQPTSNVEKLCYSDLKVIKREMLDNEHAHGRRYKRRYNIEVEDVHNYILPGGLISANCSAAALNGLLKLIEDGVPNTIFMFCSTEDILNTIKSRSINLEVTTIPPAIMAPRIQYVAEQENIAVDDSIISKICMKSEGHMRNALSLLQLYALGGEVVLRTPLTLIANFFKNSIAHNPKALDILVDILKYPTTDIVQGIDMFIKTCFTAQPSSPYYIFYKSGAVYNIFSFIYNNVGQQALKSEVGTELLLRAFYMKCNPIK